MTADTQDLDARADATSYELDDDPSRVDTDAVWGFLSTDAYWARDRTREEFDHQVNVSWRVVGAYLVPSGQMIGFARATSDGVRLAYLGDVWVADEHRGAGIGKALVRHMIDDGPGASFRWLLHTSDAHGLYEQFGFEPADPSRVMERPYQSR